MRLIKSWLMAAALIVTWAISGTDSFAADTVAYQFNVGHLRAQIAFGTHGIYDSPAFINEKTGAEIISGGQAVELLDEAGYGKAARQIESLPVIRRVLQSEGAIAVHLPDHDYPDRPDDSAGLLYVPSPSEASFDTENVFNCNGILFHLSRNRVMDSDCTNRLCRGTVNSSDPNDTCNACICTFDSCLPPLGCADCPSSGQASLLDRVLELCRASGGCDPDRFLDTKRLEGVERRPL